MNRFNRFSSAFWYSDVDKALSSETTAFWGPLIQQNFRTANLLHEHEIARDKVLTEACVGENKEMLLNFVGHTDLGFVSTIM